MTKRKTSTQKKKSTAGPITKKATFKIRRSSGDLVSIQVTATVRRPKGVKLTRQLLQKMVQHKAETSTGQYHRGPRGGIKVSGASEGVDPKGVKLKIVAWKNPDRKKRGDRAWRNYGSQAERWGSLRRALAKASINI